MFAIHAKNNFSLLAKIINQHKEILCSGQSIHSALAPRSQNSSGSTFKSSSFGHRLFPSPDRDIERTCRRVQSGYHFHPIRPHQLLKPSWTQTTSDQCTEQTRTKWVPTPRHKFSTLNCDSFNWNYIELFGSRWAVQLRSLYEAWYESLKQSEVRMEKCLKSKGNALSGAQPSERTLWRSLPVFPDAAQIMIWDTSRIQDVLTVVVETESWHTQTESGRPETMPRI